MSSKFKFWRKPKYSTMLLVNLVIFISYAAAVNSVSYKEDVTVSPKLYREKFAYKKGHKSNIISANDGSAEINKDRFRAGNYKKGCSSWRDVKEGEVRKFSNRVNSGGSGEPKFLDGVNSNNPGHPQFLDREKSNNPANAEFLDRVKSNNPGNPEFLDRVKSISPGEMTMRQSEDDDDDDDDGGEYEGLTESRNLSENTQTQCDKKDSVPVMIIRQLDMVAMGMPIKDSPKEKDKDRSEDKPGDGTSEVYKKGKGRLRANSRQKEQSAFGNESGYKLMP